MNTHLNGRESLRISESEWLTSTISQFIDGICGISDQPLLLTTYVPTSVPSEVAPIPHKWQTDQLLNGVADDFDELPLHQSTDDTSSINTDPTTFSPQAEGIHQSRGMSNEKSKVSKFTSTHDPSALFESQPSRSNKVSTHYSSDPTASIKYSDSLPASKVKSGSLVSKRREFQDFGNNFHNAAMERLQLSNSLPLQMQRIQDLVKGTGNIQRLEKEKARVKNELKEYDASFSFRFGALPGREDKEPLRPLYMYYRRLKIAIQRGCRKADQSKSAHYRTYDVLSKLEVSSEATDSTYIEDIPDDEREEKILSRLQYEKTRIRNQLQRFHENFVQTQGRQIKFHRDIIQIEKEYKQYKQLKDHIRRLDETIKRKKTFKKLSSSHVMSQFI